MPFYTVSKKQRQRIFSMILFGTSDILKLVGLIDESTQDTTVVAFPMKHM